MLLNQYYAFEPHEPYVTLIEYEMYFAYLFSYLDKNPRWVTDGANSDYCSYFPEDY
jgi:hypothetical protein